MKINLKVLLVVGLIIGISYWAVNSIFPRSYSGSALNFGIGNGTVTVTNPSTESVPAQLIAKSKSFRVSSNAEALSGSPTRQGSGTAATYLFEFELPPGESAFLITRGSDVSFVTTTATQLEATVQPSSASAARTTITVAVIVVLISLFYLSHTVEHGWLNLFRRQETPVTSLKPAVEGAVAGADRGYKPYGDNRANQ